MARARGSGRVYQPRYRDRRRKRRRAGTWAIRWYNRRTKTHEDEYGFRSRTAAERALRDRLSDQDSGRLAGRSVERTTFEDLAALIETDYQVNQRDTKARLRQCLLHLQGAFARSRALDITEERIAAYVAGRLEAGAAAATVNRELSALRRAFRLGMESQRVGRRPVIRLLREDNVRKGFFEAAQLEAVLSRLPEHLQPVLRVAYVTGWRVQSELLTRQWRHVDLVGGWLRLEPGEGKTGEGRAFPLDPSLRPVLEAQRARTTALEQAQGWIIPWVFHREGEPIRTFRRAWLSALVAAGLATEQRDSRGRLTRKVPQRLLHDFRRTAVRNLIRAGVAQAVAMSLVGHRTASVFRRYAIVDEAMLKEGAAKLGQS